VELIGVSPAVEHVWQWFWELDTRRQSGFAANAITWSEVIAWSTLTGYHLRRWEAAAIFRMDMARLAILNDTPDPSKPKIKPITKTGMRGLAKRLNKRNRDGRRSKSVGPDRHPVRPRGEEGPR
jgi:hypothetical protein